MVSSQTHKRAPAYRIFPGVDYDLAVTVTEIQQGDAAVLL